MNKAEKTRLGDQAKQILENPAWKCITESMTHTLQESWSDCQDPVAREELWHKQNALQDLIGDIESVIMNGELAKND